LAVEWLGRIDWGKVELKLEQDTGEEEEGESGDLEEGTTSLIQFDRISAKS